MTNERVTNTSFEQEVASGERFAFGENWTRFLKLLNDERIQQSIDNLRVMLDKEHLKGKSFLDIGSGSGLSSLAARRLGAKVVSFDFDPNSVACTTEVRRRYFPGDADWHIETGSVLDRRFLNSLGQFDVVYSWGVLHHTGQMWEAFKNIHENVAQGGLLFLAIYNDQGRASRLWWVTKKAYVSLPRFLRWLVLIPAYIRLWGPTTVKDILRLQPFRTWRSYTSNRGMSAHRDVIDWVGGFPFEVAKPEQIFEFYKNLGYRLVMLRTCAGGHGCNEYVFQREHKA